MAELQKSAGASGETVKNFLATLAENNRLGLLPGVCGKFGELMSAARGEVEMVVTSAQVRRQSRSGGRIGPGIWEERNANERGANRLWTTRPSPASRPPSPSRATSVLARSSRSRTLYAQLPPSFPSPIPDPNKCIQVNPDIVGGLVVEVGDRTIDLSVSSKLAKMNKLLTETL